jgi:hypothetical protein
METVKVTILMDENDIELPNDDVFVTRSPEREDSGERTKQEEHYMSARTR